MQQSYQQQLAHLNAVQQQTASMGVPAHKSEQFKVQQAQEELQIKSNLDYENRLRGHMYQFDETEKGRAAAIKAAKLS
jgi:hypothetical protein